MSTPSGNSEPPPSSASPPPPSGPKPTKPIPASFSVLEHTGIPKSVLSWKPRLPSRNWSIFLSIVGTISYLYYDDRRQCKKIRREYVDKVKGLADEPLNGSLDVPRKVKVYGARWPEDDDEDRALRYFRKYIKPYLVAAAVDYEQVTSPLYGSITRQVQASILRQRRQALKLEPPSSQINLPGTLDPAAQAQRELEGGIILIGRPSLKEYMEGLRRGYGNGVNPWKWETEVENQIKDDGVFDDPVPKEVEMIDEGIPGDVPLSVPAATPPKPLSPLPSGLSFLSRPPPPPPSSLNQTSSSPNEPPQIPEHLHLPPSPLPPQPPILLVPFTNHLGFKQFPLVIWDFFNERKRVRQGAEAAMKLIAGDTREFIGPRDDSETSSGESGTFAASYDSPSSLSIASPSIPDTEFDRQAESYYLKSFKTLPERFEKARNEYYSSLKDRLISVRQLASGERQLTPEEEKSKTPLKTEADLREERRKKELRWRGMEDGYEVVRPETDVAWRNDWKGWLKVYDGNGEFHVVPTTGGEFDK